MIREEKLRIAEQRWIAVDAISQEKPNIHKVLIQRGDEKHGSPLIFN